MRRSILILLSLLSLTFSGCATAKLAPDATPDQKAAAKAADCRAAEDAYKLADKCLNQPDIDSDAQKYWNAYKLGAELALTIECKSAVPATATTPIQ